MSFQTSVLFLLLAAVLEVSGDALIRSGMRAGNLTRIGLFAAGAAVLFVYGYFVNTPSWDFGRLLGIYIVLFFVTSQIVAWGFFHETPRTPLLIGGMLIVSGGFVITVWR